VVKEVKNIKYLSTSSLVVVIHVKDNDRRDSGYFGHI